MTKIEFHFRKLTIAERFRQLQGELIALMDESPRHAERNAVRLAAVHASQSADQLEGEPALDLEAMLHLSIVSVQQQKRMNQREPVGSEVLSTNEKGHAANVTPFVNR